MPFEHRPSNGLVMKERRGSAWRSTGSARPVGALALAVVIAAAPLLGCEVLPPPPGSEALGAWSISAEPVRGLADGGAGELRPDGTPWCSLADVVPAPFRFDAIVTRDPETGHAWLTLGAGYPRDAGWDGQVLDSTASVRRLFPSCAACPPTIATERVRVALLSRSQSEAVSRRCPANALEGGLPTPPGPDGGIRGPGQTPDGFDALYACGELVFSVALSEPPKPEADCPPGCDGCVVRYTLQGERR